MPLARCQALADTAKLLKVNLICIIICTTSKKSTKIWTIDLKKKFKPQKLEFSWKENSSVPIGWRLRFLRELRSQRCVRVRWMETPLKAVLHRTDQTVFDSKVT